MNFRPSGVIVDEKGHPCRVHRGHKDIDQPGHREVIAAVAGKCIRVIGGTFMSNAEVAAYFSSGTGACSKKSGTFYLVASQGFNLNGDLDGHFQTNKGEALNINLSTAAAVGCTFRYILTEAEDPT